MERKRGLFDIVASLMEALEESDCNKTTLASKANLATRALTSYINLVLTFNLVRKDENNYFKITNKGKAFLEEYKKLKMFIEE